mgnify:FL=1
MQSNVSLNQEQIVTVSFEQSGSQFSYDPYPITQTGQKLDLTKNQCHLNPERISINFELVHPLLREHTKAYLSDACKRYANISLLNHFRLFIEFSFNDDVTSEEDLSDSVIQQMQQFMQSEKMDASQKSTLRTIYGWFVDEQFPGFDEDFFDFYLDILKFGSNEGKGKDVLMEIRDRGPLTIREQKSFNQAMKNINIDSLSIIELQGMVALKIGQVLGARDTQIIRIQFKEM